MFDQCYILPTSPIPAQIKEEGKTNHQGKTTQDISDMALSSKKAKTTAAIANNHLKCSITQCLMFDPVVADDENVYECLAIVEWLKNNSTSPLDNITPISVSGLRGVRTVKNMIEEFITTAECTEEMKDDYNAAKKASTLAKAETLFFDGKVLEAANSGYPKAMGIIANNYALGLRGFGVDPVKAFGFAANAADEGDEVGIFILATCFKEGWGVPIDYVSALKWYKLCEYKYHAHANNQMGSIYHEHGDNQDYKKAAECFRIAAEYGCYSSEYSLAGLYFNGLGVEQSFAEAGKRFKIAADQNHAKSQFELGVMVIKKQGSNEGTFTEGMDLVEKAVNQGNGKAIAYMKKFRGGQI